MDQQRPARGPYSRKPFDLSLIQPQDREWFWSLFDRRDPDACWIWPRAATVSGHGKLHFYGQALTAHCLAFILAHGPIPERRVIAHRCDQPACCNPAHLRAVTHAVNMRETAWRNRKNRPGGKPKSGGVNNVDPDKRPDTAAPESRL